MTLFILNAYPLQLIQAEELKSKFALDNEHCYLILKDYTNESRSDKINNLEEISKYGGYKEVLFLEYKFSNGREFLLRQLEYRKVIIDFIRNHRAISRIVFGHYGNQVMKDIANKFINEFEIIFIDEGIGTLNYYAIREGHKREELSLKKKVRNILTSLFYNFNNKEVRNAIFFTAFNLESSKNTKVVRNRYDLIKKASNVKRRDNKVYIIGNPFVERGLLTKDDYYTFLTEVLNSYPNTEILYLPHPYEKPEFLDDISGHFNLRLYRYTEPSLELHLLNSDSMPEVLVTTVSTALLYSYYLFGDQMNYVSIKLNRSKWKYQSNAIDEIYQYYRRLQSSFFKVIDL